MEILHKLFGSSGFMPHGMCYLWNARLIYLHVISDGLIALSYFAIPLILIWLVRKRRNVPFGWVFGLFGVFIVACGLTHVMEIWNLWHADYWLSGVIKALTAVASIATAIALLHVVPEAIDLPDAAQWIRANAALEDEIRKRRDTELDLRVSESNYREQAELLDLTHDAIFVRELRDKIVYWNRAAERLYGWSSKEARGQIAHELLQTRFPIPLVQIEEEVQARGYWEGELVHRSRDGSEIYVSSRWSLRTNAAGQPVSFLESNRDITRRRQEQEQFRNLLESAPDAMVIVDGRGQIQLVNAQTERLFGYSREELIGKPVELLMPQRFHRQHMLHRSTYSNSPQSREMGAGLELQGRGKNGAEFPVEISLSPLKTPAGTLISSAIRNVSDRRQAEEQIRKLNFVLNDQVALLAAANKELESFSYSVSHDLRAPLRHIDGFARILKEEHAAGLSEEGIRYLDRVLEAANHMGRLVDDLIKLARVGRREISKQKVRLEDLVRQAIEDLSPETQQRNIEWLIEPLAYAECDPGLIKVVFTNLLSNAVKFTRTREKPVIEIGECESRGVPAYFVRDNGVGFDQKYANKLFGVFQRLHRQEEFEGTGIGLATVQRILKRHGGDIWAESEPDCGASFFFTLGLQPAQQALDPEREVAFGRTQGG
ncbi:MAG TPA: PAS domain S-box protein [Candidatus Acidoferrales bacterium]|jgi:PAS domain S-box-containing protein|nr:PAS domain S-box protein [Candidatus Acidoferrales bacterium]